MDADAIQEGGSFGDDFNSVEPEAGSIRPDMVDGISTGGEVNGELGRASEILTRLELDLACSSEKLVNLNILTMHVANRETDFESFMSEKNFMLVDSVEKALEFDILSGILDSEVREVDKFMKNIETDIIGASETISSFKNLGETFFRMEEKLHDSEESLKQSQDQVSEIKTQSADFQRTLSCLHGNEYWNDERGMNISEADQCYNNNAKLTMQTVEQQRHILRMLEKSLAREIDLEKKLAESRQSEEEMKLKILSIEKGLEEEAMDVSERLFEAENAAEVFMGISKELLGQIQIVQFNLNSSIHREVELRSKLVESNEKLEAKETALRKLESGGTRVNDFLLAQTENLKAKLTEAENKFILADAEAFTLQEKIDLLENQLKESELNLLNEKASANETREQPDISYSELNKLESVIDDLKDKLSNVEKRADNAELRCKLLGEANMELNEELNLFKNHNVTSEKVEALERQLKESEIRLLNAVASDEAGQEKQNMLNSTIEDMEHLIEDLKLKVSKAEKRADSAEDKCIILSETNAELTEELSFLRGRLDCLEASLNQAEKLKIATAKDISIRTKLIANFLMQLTVERERLHQQISSLAMENQILVVKLKQTNKDPSTIGSHENRGNINDFLFTKQDSNTAFAGESNEEITKLSADGSEMDKATDSVGESEVKPADATSEFENVRRIDAKLLSFKHISLALLILLISVAAYFLQKHECPF